MLYERFAQLSCRFQPVGAVRQEAPTGADAIDVRVVDASETLEALEHFGLAPSSMGRSVADDPAYHLAAGAAGILAAEAAEAGEAGG